MSKGKKALLVLGAEFLMVWQDYRAALAFPSAVKLKEMPETWKRLKGFFE